MTFIPLSWPFCKNLEKPLCCKRLSFMQLGILHLVAALI